MRRRLIIGIAIVSLVVLLTIVFAWKSTDPRITAIQQMGGKVFVDKTLHIGEVTHVSLVDAQFSDADMVQLEDWSKLSSLNLSGTQITDKSLQELKRFIGLRTLVLRGTMVTDHGASNIEYLKALQILNLEETQIGDAGLVHLRGLTNLQHLLLNKSKVTDAGVAQLKTALPLTEIHFQIEKPVASNKKVDETKETDLEESAKKDGVKEATVKSDGDEKGKETK